MKDYLGFLDDALDELGVFRILASLASFQLAMRHDRRFASAPGIGLILVRRPSTFRTQLVEKQFGFVPAHELVIRLEQTDLGLRSAEQAIAALRQASGGQAVMLAANKLTEPGAS